MKMQQTTLVVNYCYCVEFSADKIDIFNAGINTVFIQHPEGLENFQTALCKALMTCTQVAEVNKKIDSFYVLGYSPEKIENLKKLGYWKNFQIIKQETIDLPI
jgi:hypothetical protein